MLQLLKPFKGCVVPPRSPRDPQSARLRRPFGRHDRNAAVHLLPAHRDVAAREPVPEPVPVLRAGMRLHHRGRGDRVIPYYEDDSVTLYLGDCCEVTEWLTADVLVTDPPYGVAYTSGRVVGRSRPGTAIRNDTSTATRDGALALWGTLPALVFGSWRAPKPDGVRQQLIWDKGTDVSSGDLSVPWGSSFEEVYILGDWPPLAPGGRAREGGIPQRVPSVLRVPKPNNASRDRVTEHPTPKPVGLMERLIQRCPPGEIADPFAGSGATLIAARNLGRRAIGIEIEERFCEVTAKRLSQDVLDFGESA